MPTAPAMSARRALVTGITGQDGRYLAELLADKGYDVVGLVRDVADARSAEVQRLVPSAKLVQGDLTDMASLLSAVEIAQPDEVYNLGAVTSVGGSWVHAERTAEVNGVGVLRLLEALREVTGGRLDRVRFLQASSSEIFGLATHAPQDERTPLQPRSPYGVAKAFGHHLTVTYRASYGAWACAAILYNHESPRRGLEFVTRKITRGVARIALGREDRLMLGDLDACRDWGYAGDYVEAMWRMLQRTSPADYVVATGQTRSVRELLDAAFARVGIGDWTPYVGQDPALLRPAEAVHLVGDASRARAELGWEPQVSFGEMVAAMVDADLAAES